MTDNPTTAAGRQLLDALMNWPGSPAERPTTCGTHPRHRSRGPQRILRRRGTEALTADSAGP